MISLFEHFTIRFAFFTRRTLFFGSSFFFLFCFSHSTIFAVIGKRIFFLTSPQEFYRSLDEFSFCSRFFAFFCSSSSCFRLSLQTGRHPQITSEAEEEEKNRTKFNGEIKNYQVIYLFLLTSFRFNEFFFLRFN